MGRTKAPSKKEKWSPGCATNGDVETCELRGNGNWSRYHAILKDGREIELRRVSNVLDLLETKALNQWYANEAISQVLSQIIHLLPDGIAEAAGLVPAKVFDAEGPAGQLAQMLAVREKNGFLTTEEQIHFAKLLYQMVYDARLQANHTANEAADWGTDAHDLIERYLKKGLWPTEAEQQEIPDPVFNSLRLFADWWTEEGITYDPDHVELIIWDMDLGVGGRLDLLGQLPGTPPDEYWVADWKTGRGLYAKNRIQMAAYCGCAAKRGFKIGGAILANIGREHGIPQFRKIAAEDLREDWNLFRDLALGYDTYKKACSVAESWNKEHRLANSRRLAADQAKAEGNAGSHLDRKAFWKDLLQAAKAFDKRLHVIMTDAKMGDITPTGFEILFQPGFEWHHDKLIESIDIIRAAAERLSGIPGFQPIVRYDNRA